MPTTPIFNMLRTLTRLLATISATCALIICLTTASKAAEKRQFSDGRSTLTVDFPNGFQGNYGFHPVNLTAVNAGSIPATWMVTINNHGMGRRGLNTKQRRERIDVPPNRTVQRQILVAVGNDDLNNRTRYLQIQIINPSGDEEPWMINNYSGSHNNAGLNKPALMTSLALSSLDHVPELSNGVHSELYAANAATDWRGYTPFSLIILTPLDWKAMPSTSHAAIGDWVRMGGHLQFIGDIPPDAPTGDTNTTIERSLGSVHHTPAPTNDKKPTFKQLPGAKEAASKAHPATLVLENKGTLLRKLLGKDANDLITERFIVWPTILVLIAFFIMITPINLFVLAPSRRRHRLFRTIPIISLAACALLALAVLLGDGVGGNGRRVIHIESRAGNENRQFITQWQASRCGALFGTSFSTEDAAFMAPLSDPGSTLGITVLGNRIEASGGWFTSRTAQSHLLQTARPGRGRIEWTGGTSDKPTAVSTFDFPLTNVYIPDENGSWWHAPEMRQGQQTPLREIHDNEATTVIRKAIAGLPQRSQLESMSQRPGHYIAFTNTPPAIESLSSIRWTDTGIITGDLTNR